LHADSRKVNRAQRDVAYSNHFEHLTFSVNFRGKSLPLTTEQKALHIPETAVLESQFHFYPATQLVFREIWIKLFFHVIRHISVIRGQTAVTEQITNPSKIPPQDLMARFAANINR
jgi:hypothetical protein